MTNLRTLHTFNRVSSTVPVVAATQKTYIVTHIFVILHMAEEEDTMESVDNDDGIDVDASESDGSIHLATIWDDDMIDLDTGKSSWKCLWCNTPFRGRHASKAVAHVAKVKGLSIAVSFFFHLRINPLLVLHSDHFSFFLSSF
jgi:hypothetical protein